MRLFLDINDRGNHRLAETVEQERGLAVEVAAGNGRDQAGNQAAGQRGFEQHRHLRRLQLAAAQPPDGTLAGQPADMLWRFQVSRCARRCVPVIALHAVALLGDDRGADAVARGRIAGAESMAVGIDRQAFGIGDAGAFGIADTRIDCTGCRLATFGKFDCLLHRNIPRMIQIEIRKFGRHQLGIGQAAERILRSVAGNVTGRGHRVRQRLVGQVRGAGMTAPLSEIDRHGGTLVAVVFDGFRFAHAHRDILADAKTDVGLGGAGAGGLCQPQHACAHLLQLFKGIAETGFTHGSILERRLAPQRGK